MNKDSMERSRILFYWDKISELNCQLNYLKKHADIRNIKLATDALRNLQIETDALGGFFCKALEELDIKEILFAGNLLRYIRHKGFISQDNNTDFVLIRNEYEKLHEYCIANRNENVIVFFGYNGKRQGFRFMETYFGHMALSNNQQNDKHIFRDVFVIDYCKDDYPFQCLISEVLRISKNTYEIETIECKV